MDLAQSSVLSAILAACAVAAEPHQTAGWVGANYTPAYAVNAVQMWHEFRPEVIDRELAAAKRHFGLTSLRVYLHNIVFDAEKEPFLQRIEEFLKLCDRHGIKPSFTFFDDCWNHTGVTLDSQPPVPGRHNGRWAACPQDAERTDEHLPRLKAYVQDVIRPHRDDPRVLWWEVFNEPNMKSPFSVTLRKLGYQWAKEAKPTQPVLCCWDDSPETDIVDAHNYSADFRGWDRQADLNPAKGAVFTEAGARWYAGKPTSNGEPCEVIHWLRQRKEADKYVPGVYLCWELMVGNSHCRWHWGTMDGAPEPPIPWCGLLWPDGTPVSFAESEAIRSYTTGEKRALLFEDFQHAPAAPEYPGWKRYGHGGAGSGYLVLPPGVKMIAGDPAWTDYLLEAAVMLKDATGNAGLVFRVNAPGPGDDEMRGYYAGFDTKSLYLGKMNNNWQELARFDLAKVACKIEPNAWNLLRVLVKGSRIRVWLNPTHGEPGLRLDLADERAPILSGSVGVRTHTCAAWFDNVVVLPSVAAPE